MANPDAAFGLRPIRRFDGAAWSGQTQKMLVEDSYATAIFIGDPVIITGVAGSDDATGHYNVANVATAGDGNRIAGVVVSVDPDPDNLNRIYLPASTGGYINVVTDPNVVFAVQDDAQATLDSGSVGDNAVLAAGSGGSTVTGLSSWELDASDTPASDASNQVLIVGVHNRPDQSVGDNVIWEVLISYHLFRADGTGAGGLLGI